MTENIVDAGSRHVNDIRSINRDLTEKALHMRCLSYLSHVKAGLLTETIFEIDESKKVLLNTNKQLLQQKIIIEHQNKQLSEKIRELKSFGHSVSHDLQAPLSRIKGFVNLLLEDYKDTLDDAVVEHLLRISHASEEMSELINSLLRLAKVSYQHLAIQNVNLSDLATQIINEIKLQDNNREFKITIKPDMKIQGDKSLLKIVLKNILENAWKFTSKVSPSIIEFGEKNIKNKRTFYIKDNGVGFNPEKAELLFKEFSRLHNKEEFSGTGTGLALAHRIINRHGGDIWAKSNKDQGTTFYFSLHDDIESFISLNNIAEVNKT
jgi:light-regulated signal transduction histidine kinase (bacteriophytochrome)